MESFAAIRPSESGRDKRLAGLWAATVLFSLCKSVPESGWRPKVYTCSAVAQTGLEEVWKGVEEYLDHIHANGYFRTNRNRQNKYWMYESINDALKESFYRDPAVAGQIADIERRVLDAKLSSFIAAKELLDIYFDDKRRGN